MSKIHEALKKIHQDRLSQQGTEVPVITDGSDPTTVLRKELASNLIVPGYGARASRQEESLRFEKFVAHCAEPEWHLDSNLFFFGEASNTTIGAEQFRTLRARLDRIRETKPLKRVEITSAVHGEGKTVIATNLAHAISRQHDRRVLLIDADFRRPMLHASLGAPIRPGLSDYLLGEAHDTDVVQRGKNRKLCFVPSGRQVTDPNELLSNGRLKELLDRMSQIFDWIIVDTPPCLPVADAAVISRVCDGVLLVVRAASTPLSLARKVAEELRGGNVLGVVLNALSDHESYDSYYPLE